MQANPYPAIGLLTSFSAVVSDESVGSIASGLQASLAIPAATNQSLTAVARAAESFRIIAIGATIVREAIDANQANVPVLFQNLLELIELRLRAGLECR